MTKRTEEIIAASKCPCPKCQDKEAKIDGNLLLGLLVLESKIGRTTTITSGGRCPAYNKSIGGYISSPHIPDEFGITRALDIQAYGIKPEDMAKAAEGIKGIKRIGIYPNHIHIDAITPRPSKFWYVSQYGTKAVYSGGTKTLKEFIKKIKGGK